MLSLHETLKRILKSAEPTEAVEVSLSEAVGLVPAEPPIADVDLPHVDRSTRGGYALRSSDASPGRTLRLVEDRRFVPAASTSTVPLARRSEPPPSHKPDDDVRNLNFSFNSDLGSDFGSDFGLGFGESEFDFTGPHDDDLHLFSPFDPDEPDEPDEPDVNAPPRSELNDDPHLFSPFDLGIELGPDEAVWVDAGDPLPIGADAVAAPEDVHAEPARRDDSFRIITPIHTINAGCNVLRRGRFLRGGAELIPGKTRIRPAMVGLLASQGCVHPLCHRRVRVAVLAVGDHLVPPGEAPILHRERNAAGLAVAIPCIQWGAMVHDLGAVPAADLDRALYRATASPVVLMMGPNSPAITAALDRLGLETEVSGVLLDPCGDVTYGVIRGESGRVESHVFRLPPNPTAALAAAAILVGPLVARLQGEAPAGAPRRKRAVWTGSSPATDHRTRIAPVRLEIDEDARLRAYPIACQGLDDLAGFAAADALAILPPSSGPWIGGELVEVATIGQGFESPGP